MSEKTESKLKPCPFCGGEVRTAIEDCYGYYGDDWLVFCDECSLQFGFTRQFETEEEAIEAWNRRAYDHDLSREKEIRKPFIFNYMYIDAETQEHKSIPLTMCPKCWDDNIGVWNCLIDRGVKYCRRCGTGIDWGDKDEREKVNKC